MNKISLFKIFLMKFAPKTFFRYIAEEHGINSKKIDFANNLFKGVKQIDIHPFEGGEPFFWSIYPSWRKKKYISGRERKILYTGNLEED